MSQETRPLSRPTLRASSEQRSTPKGWTTLALVAAATGLIASGCGASAQAVVSGAGASTQSLVTTAWLNPFESHTGSAFRYEPVGSDLGLEMFLDGRVDFAGSDTYLTPEQIELSKTRCAGSLGAVNVPTLLSSIGLTYNVPSLEGERLNLSADVIAGIFSADITNWSDPVIVADNPDLDLPDLAITPVYRFGSSGTTQNFTEFLSEAAPEAWGYGEFSTWSDDGPIVGESAAYSHDSASAVAATEGAIGYVDVAYAGDLPVAAIGVGDRFVLPTDESVAEALADATLAYPEAALDLAYDIDRTPESATAYPLAMVSYTIVCLQYDDVRTADMVSSYLDFSTSAEAQALAAEAAGAVPMDADTANRVDAISVSISGRRVDPAIASVG